MPNFVTICDRLMELQSETDMTQSSAAFAERVFQRLMNWPRRSGPLVGQFYVIFALCAIRASQSILNRDAEAGYSLTHNLCKQPPAFRSLKFLHCSSALRQCVSLANCRSQTLLTLGFPKLRKHSLRTKFESSANSCAAFTLENCLRSRMPLI